MALRIDDVDLQRDRILVERFQEGDPTAFETLYQRYFARLKRFCLKRVGDPYEAEEIAQEAFTRAYRALPDLAGERRFYPWMTVIAGRLCVDHHRRRGRTEPAADIDLGSVEGGQDAIVDRADFTLLTAALDRLAPRHREVLEMREHRGLSYQQIADHYEVPIGTVEALLFRARKALKREFFAIATPERGGLVAVPVLGAALRKWALLKTKVAGWASTLPPAVAPALGIAAVVGSAAVVGTAVLPDIVGTPQRPSAVVRMVGGSASAETPETFDGLQPATIGGPSAGASDTGEASPTRNGAVGVADVEAATPVADVTRAQTGRDETEDHPIKVDTGNAFAALDPAQIQTDAASKLDDAVVYLTTGGQE